MFKQSLRTSVGLVFAILVLPLCNASESTTLALKQLVVTQVPVVNKVAMLADRLNPANRYPQGSRVILVNIQSDQQPVVVLTDTLYSAGAPALSPHADAILFTGRQRQQDPFAIYYSNFKGELRQVIARDYDCIDPQFLPKDRLVFACAVGNGKDPRFHVWALFTASLDGSKITQITFGPGSAFDPTPLQDGRLLFSMWQAPGSGRAVASTGLFTVNPDGTLLDAFSGSHRAPIIKARARQSQHGKVVFIAADQATSPQIGQAEMRRPLSSYSVRSLQKPFNPTGIGAIEPLADNSYLIAWKIQQSWGIYHQHTFDQPQQNLFDTADWHEVEALAVAQTKPPRGRPSSRRQALKNALLVGYDADRSDMRVTQKTAGPAKVVTVALKRSPEQIVNLGTAEIMSDGSFFLEVPADQPIQLTTLDQNGDIIATSAWIWLRQGEVRACFGCHENREAAPINKTVDAIFSKPAVLTTY